MKNPAEDPSFANWRLVMDKMDKCLLTKTEYAKFRRASGADCR
jgi:hypothetical protein